MLKNKLVLISGPQEAGKSTLAQALIDHWRFERYSFATMVREELIAHGVITREEAYAKPTDLRTRGALIGWGQAKQQMQSDYWAQQVILPDCDCVIDDLRNKTEYDTMLKRYLPTKKIVMVYLKADIPEGQGMYAFEFFEQFADLVIPAKSNTPLHLAQQILDLYEVC